MVKWRAEQATRLAEDSALTSKDLVGAVAASTQAALAERGERIAEIAEEVRDSLVEQAEATRGIVTEKAEDAVEYWQGTGRAKSEQAARLAAETSVKVAEETARASMQLGSVVAGGTKEALLMGGERVAEIASSANVSDIGSAVKTLSPKHQLQSVRSNAEARVREEMTEQLAQERAAHEAEKSALLELARTKSQERRAAVAEAASAAAAAAAAAGGAAAAAAQSVMWECDVDGIWHRYSDCISEILEQAFQDQRGGGSGGGGDSGGALGFKSRGHNYRADLVSMRQTNAATGVARSIRRRVEQLPEHFAVPETWAPQRPGEHCMLVRVDEGTAEFDEVFARMTATLPSARIAKLERIQNYLLWDYYRMRRDRMVKLAGGGDPREVSVWHGTGNPLSAGDGVHPATIYADRQDGLMMQYSAEGMWGRGLYFARDARYSDSYAFDLEDDTKCLLLVRLLAGDEVRVMPNDRSLRFCPDKPGGAGRYDTVTGETAGSKVYIVYENGRAYPEYLITYTR